MSDTEFVGFTDKTLPFLKALDFHQNREWFHENKKLYEAHVKKPLGDLVDTTSARFAEAGLPLRGSRKTSTYRVNRDVRFSKNKEPYNTHMSALLTRNGTKKEQGFVYMHFANERSFIASGVYGLETKELQALRELIVREPDTMRNLVADLEAAGYPLDFSEALKRNPRGFNPDSEEVERWIRLKHFTFVEEIDNAIITTPAIVDRLVALGQASVPFLNFAWRAIDSVRDEETS